MKLWMLIGVLVLIGTPDAFAHEGRASVRCRGFELVRVDADLADAQKHADPKVRPPPPPPAPPPRTTATPAPPPRVFDSCDLDTDCVRAREDARRRRRGSMEAIPDALLLGRRGAL